MSQMSTHMIEDFFTMGFCEVTIDTNWIGAYAFRERGLWTNHNNANVHALGVISQTLYNHPIGVNSKNSTIKDDQTWYFMQSTLYSFIAVEDHSNFISLTP